MRLLFSYKELECDIKHIQVDWKEWRKKQEREKEKQGWEEGK
jgi:hypothetical protein